MPPAAMDPWPLVDPLADVLDVLRMSGVFYCRSELTAPWALDVPRFPHSMMLHVVTEGGCWIEVEGAAPCHLAPGALALVPHGDGHRLVGDAAAAPIPLFDASRELLSPRYEVLRHGGRGAATAMWCGLVRFDHPAADQLIRWLPKVIHLQVDDAPQAEWLQSTLRLVAAEARAMHAGSDAVITRLADLLVVAAIRSWITRQPAHDIGWLGALRDRQIGRALSLIHHDPACRWTVEALAFEVGMSRSAFAARFTRLVGTPALRYATEWKMRAAHVALQQERTPVAAIADRLGYSTEAAFSRAFKRSIGLSPGAARRRHPSVDAIA